MTSKKELEKTIHKLTFEKLRLRLEIEELTSRPEGRAAKKIIAKYNKERIERDETFSELMN